MEPYWGEANGHPPHSVKYESEAAVSSFPYCTESSLNFSTSATTYSEDDAEYATGRRNKTSRQDPLSHRIIEKRRRDRMNSCLADLSRLIPPQYQRKGRGRIEKTEIIEMAIRHLKHLKNECSQKENDYRLGYTDCMKEVAKFLYDSQMQEFCYRLLPRLQEHCDEVMKTDCYKTRNCHAAPPDNVSASSGSPHQMFHPGQPLCQLRDMIASSDIEHSNDHNDVKDLSFRNHLNQLQRQLNSGGGAPIAGSSAASQNAASSAASSSLNGHVANGPLAAAADAHPPSAIASPTTAATVSPPTVLVSAASASSTTSAAGVIAGASAQQPHQAAVITSTAPGSLLLQHQHHADSSNHDFESSREPLLHTDTSNMHSPPPRDSLLNQHSHHAHLHHHSLSQHSHHSNHNHHNHDSISMTLSERMRNFSESSHDVEHNNNYKYKNHIKERFNHELHDEETSSEHCHPATAAHLHASEDHSHTHSMSEHSKDGTEPEIAPIIAKKRKLAEAAAAAAGDCDTLSMPLVATARTTPISPASGDLLLAGGREEKPFSFGDIKTELTGSSGSSSAASVARLAAPSGSGTVVGGSPSAPSGRSFAVPIFALHGQGTYYIPLNIDYNVLVPFLNGVDLLEKNYGSAMPVVHPININVNFMPPTASASFLAVAAAAVAAAAGKQQLQSQANGASVNGAVSATVGPGVAAPTKAKLKNGW